MKVESYQGAVCDRSSENSPQRGQAPARAYDPAPPSGPATVPASASHLAYRPPTSGCRGVHFAVTDTGCGRLLYSTTCIQASTNSRQRRFARSTRCPLPAFASAARDLVRHPFGSLPECAATSDSAPPVRTPARPRNAITPSRQPARASPNLTASFLSLPRRQRLSFRLTASFLFDCCRDLHRH